MDRRVLAGVAVLAVIAAVVFATLTGPSVAPVDPPAKASRAAPPAPVAAARARPGVAPVARVGTPGSADMEGKAVPAGIRPPVSGLAAPIAAVPPPAVDAEASPEYRCTVLGQQADLIDRLVVVGSGSVLDEDQRAEMLSRVAELAVRVAEDGHAIRSGDLKCEGIAAIDLGNAASYLRRTQDELDIDEDARAQVQQALGVLDDLSGSDP